MRKFFENLFRYRWGIRIVKIDKLKKKKEQAENEAWDNWRDSLIKK